MWHSVVESALDEKSIDGKILYNDPANDPGSCCQYGTNFPAFGWADERYEFEI